MWQLRKKLLRLTERLHFGELNQLNGCGRAEREAGCVRRAEELSGKCLSFSCQGWIFFLSLCFIGEALTRRSLFLIFQSRFSLLSVLLSLSSLLFLPCASFYFGQITFSSSAHTLTFISFFSITQQTDRQTPRWGKTGPRFKVCSRSCSVKAEEWSHYLSLLEEI